MIKCLKDKVKGIAFSYYTLLGVAYGRLRITKKGKVKKNGRK